MTEQTAIAFLQATELVSMLSSSELKITDVAQAIEQQIQSSNPSINAFDSRADQIAPRHDGPLCGLPISVKDQIQVAGMPCNFGLDKPTGELSQQTASPILRLLEAGVSILGKTNLPPFAMDFQSFNARIGRTNNPWNHAYTAGGSSGGGAAAVAAGMSYLDIGADLAGSLRIPAAFCGVFSLLPTEGALASDGMLQGNATLPHFARMGPIARSVDDIMMAWEYLSGTTPSQPPNIPGRIAIWQPNSDDVVDEYTVNVFRHTNSLLATRGTSVTETHNPQIMNARTYGCFGEIMGYETGGLTPPLARWLGRLFGRAAAKRSPDFLTHVHSGQARNRTRYEAALAQREGIQSIFDKEYADCEAVLLPVARVSAFKHREPTSDRGGIRDYKEPFQINDQEIGYLDAITSFTTPISVIGNPVVTIPLGIDTRGLPVGAQLIGKRDQEWQLLNTAKQLMTKLPPVNLSASQ